MDRFREPTKKEMDEQAGIEAIHETLFDALGRDPTDKELEDAIDKYCEDWIDYESDEDD